MVPVSKRMKKIADMVSAKRVADIGCDHGFVSIYLIKEKNVDHVFAMDINDGPLKRAHEHVNDYGMSERIDVIKSDGAKALEPGDADGAVIAGMGGRLTERIISDSIEVFQKMDEMILSPQSEIDHVRSFLVQNGFEIIDEDMVYDESKFYVIIKCSYDADFTRQINDVQALYGPVLIKKKHPVLIDYLKDRLVKLEDIIERIDTGSELKTGKNNTRADEVNGEIELIRGLLDKIQD
jgi:tRNA (adenine22-N1)-methyltransferase